MYGELLELSHQEWDRVKVVQAVIQRHLTQAQAAEQLQLSTRQVKRLIRRYRGDGPAGLVSRHRGRPGNNRIDAAVRTKYLGLLRESYPDFGPTFAHEKLVEQHGFRHSVETLRQWMIEDGLWHTRASRAPRLFHLRERRSCRGGVGADRWLTA